MSAGPRTILLVEDNAADVRLAMEAIRQSGRSCRVLLARDGARALDMLRREAEHAEAPRPDLILLDLNLPKTNGFQVLAQIKVDPDLQSIPVVIMSTSGAEEDIRAAYQLHANCYLTKPGNLEDYFAAMDELQEFWLEVATLPPGEAAGGWERS